jgi:hypothetical protein
MTLAYCVLRPQPTLVVELAIIHWGHAHSSRPLLNPVDRQPAARFDLVRQILYFWRHARFRAV